MVITHSVVNHGLRKLIKNDPGRRAANLRRQSLGFREIACFHDRHVGSLDARDCARGYGVKGRSEGDLGC